MCIDIERVHINRRLSDVVKNPAPTTSGNMHSSKTTAQRLKHKVDKNKTGKVQQQCKNTQQVYRIKKCILTVDCLMW